MSKTKALVMNENFVLTIPAGSVIHFKDGSQIQLTEIPKEAQALWESGSPDFSLRKGSESLFDQHSKQQIENLIAIRKPFEIAVELQVLSAVLKSKTSKTPGKKPDEK